MVCPKCGTVLFDNLTAVLVDAGNGETAVVYGYYNYDEAKKCFDLTYQYKEENGFLYDGWEYKWDDSVYGYSCIRTAEMAYLYNSGYEGTFHNRPNGKELECSGENLTYKIEVDSDVISIYLAEEALDSWLNSMGHRYTLEDSASNTVLAQFTAWIPKYECWGTFWVQNFY